MLWLDRADQTVDRRAFLRMAVASAAATLAPPGSARHLPTSSETFRPKDTIVLDLDLFGWPGLPHLREIHLSVKRGETLAILANNGAGKTTLLNLMAGRLPQRSDGRELVGELTMFGESVASFDCGGSVGWLDPPRVQPGQTTVEDFVADNLAATGPADPSLVRTVVAIAGLTSFVTARLDHLACGDRIRVALAREFTARPQILLVDNAFAACDDKQREELYAVLSVLQRRFRTTVIMAGSDPQEAVFNANHIVHLSRTGGTVNEILRIDQHLPRTFRYAETSSRFASQCRHLSNIMELDRRDAQQRAAYGA
jgi:ABC-type nitrate/sulfonate/bicarbonate transport system ATPase subunit